MKFGRKLETMLTILVPVLALTLGGCGSTSNPAVVDSSLTTSTNGTTVSEVVVISSDSAAKVTVPQSTTLFSDYAKTQPVNGTVTTTVTAITNVSALPPVAQTGALVGSSGMVLDTIGGVADITMTNGTSPIIAFGTPITVNLKLASGYAVVGSSVDFYSIDGSGNWTKEGTATVKADGSIDMIITHLSGNGAARFKSSTSNIVFTTAMVSGKTFTNASSGATITFNSNGTITSSKSSSGTTWTLNTDGTILLSYSGGWDKLTLTQNNSPNSLVINELGSNGSTTVLTWNY